jgi:hypothetical protein
VVGDEHGRLGGDALGALDCGEQLVAVEAGLGARLQVVLDAGVAAGADAGADGDEFLLRRVQVLLIGFHRSQSFRWLQLRLIRGQCGSSLRLRVSIPSGT